MTKQRQRPIKFRAWDKKEKRMCPVVYALFPYTYWGKKGFWIDAGYYRRPQDGGLLYLDTGLVGKRFELMQFTGLHDKNGKEIYEGNVVRFELSKVDMDEPSITHGFYEVVFDDGMFCVALPEGNYQLCEYLNQELEVIGNIYENPELLEPKEK